MKKILLFILFIGLGLHHVSAQVSFAISTNPIDSVTSGTQNLDESVIMRGYVVNTGTVPYRLKWQLVTDETDRPNQWFLFGICDNWFCRNAFNDSLETWHAQQSTANILPGDSTIFEVHAGVHFTFPDGLGIFKIKIYDSLQTQVDTVVFRLCKGTCNTTGISRPEEVYHIAVYPNPVNDNVQVRLDGFKGDRSAVVLRLYDHTGRQLLEQPAPARLNTLRINTLPSGIYFLQLRYKGQVIKNEKIVKQ